VDKVIECDSQEDLRREAKDYRVVPNKQVSDDQVSVFSAHYQFLLEAVKYVDAHHLLS
jgi:hypothetical protein